MRRVFSRTIYCIAIILPSLVAVTAHPSQTLRQPTSGKGFSLHNENVVSNRAPVVFRDPLRHVGHGTPIASANSARIGPSTLGKGTVFFSAHTSAEMPGFAFLLLQSARFPLGETGTSFTNVKCASLEIVQEQLLFRVSVQSLCLAFV